MSKIEFMKLKKYKLGNIARIEISGVDKKQKRANSLFAFVILLMSIITGQSPKKRLSRLWLHQLNSQRETHCRN